MYSCYNCFLLLNKLQFVYLLLPIIIGNKIYNAKQEGCDGIN